MTTSRLDWAESSLIPTCVFKAALPSKPSSHFGRVIYEIHLHPTYQVPCLWFSLHDLPVDEPSLTLDTVFRRLVPDQYKDGLRNAGAVGGISADVCFPFTLFFSFSAVNRVNYATLRCVKTGLD